MGRRLIFSFSAILVGNARMKRIKDKDRQIVSMRITFSIFFS